MKKQSKSRSKPVATPNAIAGLKGFQHITPAKRFWDKVDRTAGCWNWLGSAVKTGYGQIWYQGRLVLAHRFAYELLRGPIPKGFEIDHLCHNKSCVNPIHLEVVTRSENVRRGWKVNIPPNSRKTHCLRGHALTPDNIYDEHGKRKCRQCRVLRDRERKARHRAAIALAKPPREGE